jgi:hypothetical protein
MAPMTSPRAYLGVMLAQAACGIACVAWGTGAVIGLGWLALAAVAGVVATRTWGRRIVGGVVTAAAVLCLVGTGLAPITIAVLGCVLTGLLTVVRGPRWPTMGGRYEREPLAKSPWQALDAGEDPTLRDG